MANRTLSMLLRLSPSSHQQSAQSFRLASILAVCTRSQTLFQQVGNCCVNHGTSYRQPVACFTSKTFFSPSAHLVNQQFSMSPMTSLSISNKSLVFPFSYFTRRQFSSSPSVMTSWKHINVDSKRVECFSCQNKSVDLMTRNTQNNSSLGDVGQMCLYSTKGTSLNSYVTKNQAALLVKRTPRKKIPRIHDEGKTRQLNNVVAYAIGEEINLESLRTILTKQGLYSIGQLPPDASATLHVRGKYNLDQQPKEIFVFDDGSVVFWRVPEVERGAFLKVLVKHCKTPYSMFIVLGEREEMDFAFVKGKSTVNGDVIHLQEGPDGESEKNILELYTFSNALAQSVKLSMWEASLEKFVTSIETVTEDVRLGRKISMSRRQVLKKSGELMSLRHLVNLSSDLLDTPDFYWERSDLEFLYQGLCGQLNISRRTKVINEKLNHCNELVDLVSSHLSDGHHTRLEVMIIVLIFVEVAIEVVDIIKHYLESRVDKSTEDKEKAAFSTKD